MGARGGPRPPALTGKGIIGVEEVDLLTAIPVDVAGCDPDGVALPVPQRVVGGAALVHRNVHQPLLGPVVLQNQVGAIVPGGGRGRGRWGEQLGPPGSIRPEQWAQSLPGQVYVGTNQPQNVPGELLYSWGTLGSLALGSPGI